MIFSRTHVSSMLLMSIGIASAILFCMTTTTHGFEAAGRQQAEKKVAVRREKNLDHWDSDTLAYYLDNYPGYDLAVMFYARWDTNSQRLAPYWNQIAAILDAGSSQSKLIMALFDCELNAAHMQMCESAGVTHYPTLMFIGSGPFHDKDPVTKILFGKNSVGMMGESPVPNTVKFQGNWQYYDAVLDWIKTMQALSRWHTWSTDGFGKKLRTFFLPKKKKNVQLPLGVPGSSSGSGVATASAGSPTSQEVAMLKQKAESWKNATDSMTKVATRAATMIESVLFGDKNSTDMFSLLHENDAWKDTKKYDTLNDIYRACTLEVSLDYCQRLADPVGTKVVDDLIAANKTTQELVAASDNIEKLIMDEITKREPYCAILDNCFVSNFKDENCRPKSCPFKNEGACRMLTSCKDESIINEYAEVLKLDVETLVAKK
mmetsp:Transcript_34092/g.80241  ORF Transcript_34092/g.80241 Transcript_34092/m.80241 type:complete len:432 (+) Transcript_34092:189-1484(+)|eukprot:CAMPEP_0172388828 /NCGR_PEP_ID=MMETSP1061-20121228/5845_2 /TAXON_ID=37318 /ORGANISM="Pseudo-nitzschia pungens, Strain cf. pungens" /LENGTH=431 /DNA_ID=CAMNT_0013118825 /DNA_START=189 /DNA_END=1484 /DNA_ORIENTATION=-